MMTSLIACVALGFVAQTPSKPTSLDALVAVFAKAESMRAEVGAVVHTGQGADERLTLRLVIKRPNFGRYEFATQPGGHSLPTVVMDGSRSWTYDEAGKTYYSEALDAGAKLFPSDVPPGMALVLQTYFDAPSIAAGKAEAPWRVALANATETTADIDGEACDVVVLKLAGATATLSVSKKTHLLHRLVEEFNDGGVRLAWDFTKIDLAPKLDDKTFTFTPPAGAQKAEPPGPPEAKLLAVGDVAPDIAGASPSAGKNLKLSDFRGKVVLLNFWFEH